MHHSRPLSVWVWVPAMDINEAACSLLGHPKLTIMQQFALVITGLSLTQLTKGAVVTTWAQNFSPLKISDSACSEPPLGAPGTPQLSSCAYSIYLWSAAALCKPLRQLKKRHARGAGASLHILNYAAAWFKELLWICANNWSYKGKVSKLFQTGRN